MFGIMRPHKCSNAHGDLRQHRLHYCGTCKTMGTQYGQAARATLNFDAVFLSELLGAISAQDTNEWNAAYHRANCFHLPDAKATLPGSLRYAAAANVLLGALKLDDRRHDDRLGWLWSPLIRFFSRATRKAEGHLREWGLDTGQMWALASAQRRTEATFFAPSADLEAYILPFAEATAEMSALVFGHGAIAVGKPEQYGNLAELGRRFGRLAYLLDAFEDAPRDRVQGDFNPLLRFFAPARDLSDANNEEVRRLLLRWTDEAAQQLTVLGENIPQQQAAIANLTARLRSNLMLRTWAERQPRLTLREKIERRAAHARVAAQQLAHGLGAGLRGVQYYLISVAVFAFPRLPEHVTPPRDGVPLKWLALFMAFLAVIGIARRGYSAAAKRKRSGKHLFRTKKQQSDCCNDACDGCGDCCNGACSNKDCWSCGGQCCITSCLCCGEAGANSCCDSACSNCGEGGNKTWLTVLIVVAVVVLLIGLLALALFFVAA